MTEKEKKNIGIIGPGRVGSAFALGLFKAGWRINTVYGRRIEYVKSLANRVEAGIAKHIREVIGGADIIFITVPDDMVLRLAGDIAESGVGIGDKVFFHTSGVLEAKALSPLKQKGGVIGSIHPLQTLANRDTGWEALAESWFALDGDKKALLQGERLIHSLSGRFFPLNPGTKPIYHAAACIAANYLITLEYIASSLFQLSGVKSDDFYSLVGPLLRRTVENIRTQGVGNALTGPVSRGDVGTVAIHLKKIQDLAPEFLTFYKIMLRHTVDLASRNGYIEQDRIKGFYRLLEVEEGDLRK